MEYGKGAGVLARGRRHGPLWSGLPPLGARIDSHRGLALRQRESQAMIKVAVG